MTNVICAYTSCKHNKGKGEEMKMDGILIEPPEEKRCNWENVEDVLVVRTKKKYTPKEFYEAFKDEYDGGRAWRPVEGTEEE